jgi:hypothetical protein
MAQVSVGRRLAHDLSLGLFLAFSCALLWHAVQMVDRWGIGWDAHAYYTAWSGDLYEHAPGTLDAYNYSPLFAQVIWPLTHLPWALFCALFIGAAAVSIAWLVRPLPLPFAIGMWLFCTPEILSGNIFWLLALCTVAGFTRGSPWCVAAFTKVVPCLGPVWFLLRGEWRRLGGFVATFVVLFAGSYALGPDLWHQWWDFLRDNAGGTPSMGGVPPLVVRLPLAAVLLVFAARTDRRWLVPVSMVLASPVIGWGTFALLAAIPRLRGRGATPDQAPAPIADIPAVAGPGTRTLAP